jgi:hypothetical protein
MANETPLITKIHQVQDWVHRDGTRPATRLKVQADTESGPLVLWISKAAARELVEDLQRSLQAKRSQ